MSWREWFGIRTSSAEDRDVLGQIAAALEGLPPERARFVAAFAYHLGRIAHADRQFTDEERRFMRAAIAYETDLPPDQVNVVVDIVVHDSRAFGGTHDFAILQELAELATLEQKRAIIRCLFALSAADSEVVVAEDNEIRQVAIGLKVSHEDFVAARSEVREHLAVLRKTASAVASAPNAIERA